MILERLLQFLVEKFISIIQKKQWLKAETAEEAEEVEHVFDPDDPIFKLCETVLTPKLRKNNKASWA